MSNQNSYGNDSIKILFQGSFLSLSSSCQRTPKEILSEVSLCWFDDFLKMKSISGTL